MHLIDSGPADGHRWAMAPAPRRQQPVIGGKLPALTCPRCGYDYRHPPGFSVSRPHGTADWLLVVTVSGAFVTDLDGARVLTPGQILVIPPGMPQRYGGDGQRGFRHHWVAFTGPAAETLVHTIGLPIGRARPLTDLAGLELALHGLEAEHLGRRPFRDLAIHAAITAVLVAAGRLVTLGGGGSPTDRLMRARSEIHARLEEDWSLAAMARLTGQSIPRFTVTYRTMFGTSPKADLLAARIDRAQLLLRSGTSISEVAQASGFHDVPHFHRTFRQHTGITPGACAGDAGS